MGIAFYLKGKVTMKTKKVRVKSKREIILDTVSDLVGRFMYYGRKEDEELPLGAIEEQIKAGQITVEEIVAQFESQLKDMLV
jgi:hypothetical protein